MKSFCKAAVLFGVGISISAGGQVRASGTGVLNPLAFAGGDVGAQVNAAFASCNGAPCTVALPPRASYRQSTMIVLPAAMGQVLDCQGTALVWNGRGDAVTVKGLNGDSPSGEIRNCTFELAAGNTAGRNGVRQESRIWFSYRNDTFFNWVNQGSAGLVIDNSAGAGWPGYNERSHVEDVSFSNDSTGIRLIANDGGTNSFARSAFRLWCNEHDGQTCFSGENGADIYSASPFAIHANLASNTPGRPAAMLALSGGSGIRTTDGFVEGECVGSVPSDLYVIADVNAKFQLPGGVWNLGGCTSVNRGTSDNVQGSVDPQGFVLQGVPYANHVQQANNSKVIWNGVSLRYGIPVMGGYPNGSFQVFNRDTSSNPEVDAEGQSGAAQVNLMNCTGFNGHTGSPGGCGFGAGYGLTAATGGTLVPRFALESTGGFGVRDATGQYRAGVTAAGRFSETLFTPASSTAACTPGEFGDDANFHYVCVGKDRWRRVALSDF